MISDKAHKWTFVLNEPVKILVADDDPIFREFAQVYLTTPVATIETAEDGQRAWERVQAEAFDLILVDIDMPHLDGFALAERIRANLKLHCLPLVMVTGREDIVSIDRAYALGATTFVTKPVNWRQLSYQLRYVLRTSRIERDMRAARDRAEEILRREFRTSLNAILRLSNLMEQGGHGPLDTAYKKYAVQIGTSGQRLLNALVETINYAQIISDTYGLNDGPDAIRRSVAVADRARDAGVGMLGDAQRTDHTPACNRQQVAHMLYQLLDNAVTAAGTLDVGGDLIAELIGQSVQEPAAAGASVPP